MKRIWILTTLLILTACAAPITATPTNTPEPPPPSPALTATAPNSSAHPLLPTETLRLPTPDLSLASGPVEQLSFPFIAVNKIDSSVPYTFPLYDLSTGGTRLIEFDIIMTHLHLVGLIMAARSSFPGTDKRVNFHGHMRSSAVICKEMNKYPFLSQSKEQLVSIDIYHHPPTI